MDTLLPYLVPMLLGLLAVGFILRGLWRTDQAASDTAEIEPPERELDPFAQPDEHAPVLEAADGLDPEQTALHRTYADEVQAAIRELPPEFASQLRNVAIVVADRPNALHRRAAGIKPWQSLYGLYQGVPLAARRGGYSLVEPDVITIFVEPLRRDFPSDTALRAQIRHTVKHEIAHHFGMSDDWLREIGAY